MSDFVDGFRYVSRNPALFCLIGLGLVLFIFIMPYQQVFIPLLALDVLEIGRSGAGWMLAFTGIGALIGSLAIASVKRMPMRGLVLMALLLVLSGSLVLLAVSRWFSIGNGVDSRRRYEYSLYGIEYNAAAGKVSDGISRSSDEFDEP